MRLRELLPDATIVPADGAGTEITGLAYDSRAVGPGDLFFCVPGFNSDGHDFAPAAVTAGACALVVERALGLGVPEATVASVRTAMAPVAARLHGDPSATLRVAGVTGTNGKTTTAFLIRALLEHAGRRCGLLGTVKSVIAGSERPVRHTTAEAIDLQRDLREMLEGGDDSAAMEVSSHALELGRVDNVRFSVAVFTNLTQDHLDFHPTMEHYFMAKRRLFTAAAVHVVNVDDAYGARLAGELPGAVTFAVDAPGAALRARDLACGPKACEFVLESGGAEHRRRDEVVLPLPGAFNVYNALAAVGAVRALGVDLDTIVAGLAVAEPVPGRMQPVAMGQSFAVLVDYAHTPDSLDNVLRAARGLTDGRVLCVFGCGGDRDRGKRPLMGAIAAGGADVAIVTSDNPRSEKPDAIISEIVAGIVSHAPADVQVVADRREAIGRAIGLARSGDVVVIAGKGHEQGQEFAAGRKLPFDDVAVARDALVAAGVAGGGA